MTDTEYTLSVTQLNEYVNTLLKRDALLGKLSVRGEISGFKRHSSGHLYFSLKDEGALIRCVMFRQSAIALNFSPQDGQSVKVSGSVSLYAKDGQYQMYVTQIEREGEGELFRRFLLLRTKLEARGYFEESHKKQIPLLPRCVGVITSPTGAAIQDIVNITKRRFPSMKLLLYPVKVQGEGAAEEIANAIYEMNCKNEADVLIVGRGGGSLEDLWAFNEEAVAESIYKSEIPVVSAVGHEIDFTIADFVADLRAPTPSSAAELCVPEYVKLRGEILGLRGALRDTVNFQIANDRSVLKGTVNSGAFVQTKHRIAQARTMVQAQRESLSAAVNAELINQCGAVDQLRAALCAMDPGNVLKRGYAMVRIPSGGYVDSASKLHPGDRAQVLWHDGSAEVEVKSTKRGINDGR